ncbi:MAG: hypothetical protein GY727_00855, partial [Gammaproteobacteria bacterium]|nr:hypothetical protein [Gammaproteobacteria bacterium]
VWYENDISWKDKYGALYNWYATADPGGLCPTGWHMPTNDEWTELTHFIGGTSSPYGNELKSCRQVNSPLGGDCSTTVHPRWDEHIYYYGTDDYGFSGLPGGNRFDNGNFAYIGWGGGWWSSSEGSDDDRGWLRYLNYNEDLVEEQESDKVRGISVRCLKD